MVTATTNPTKNSVKKKNRAPARLGLETVNRITEDIIRADTIPAVPQVRYENARKTAIERKCPKPFAQQTSLTGIVWLIGSS